MKILLVIIFISLSAISLALAVKKFINWLSEDLDDSGYRGE